MTVRTSEELAGAAEHLIYEIEMLKGTCLALESGFFPPGLLQNALIESFAMHARNLVYFLDAERPYKSDILADDFLLEPSTWHSIKGSIPPSIQPVLDRTNKEVAHLTYDRLGVRDEAKSWDCSAILDAITERFECWRRLVPPGITGLS